MNEPNTLHPIQLRAVWVEQLHITVNDRTPRVATGEYPVVISVGHGLLENKIIKVAMKAETPTGDDLTLPYTLLVELIGVFEVDELQFPVEEIGHWAQHNAPFVLFPYLREQVYNLTNRAGFKAAILPLVATPVRGIAPTAKPELPTKPKTAKLNPKSKG